MGARLGFPDWFGHHWDAFLDCLRTVVDNADHDLTVVVREAGALLTDEQPGVLGIFLAVLSQVRDRPGTTPGSSLLVADASDRLSGLARRMTGAGCSVDRRRPECFCVLLISTATELHAVSPERSAHVQFEQS